MVMVDSSMSFQPAEYCFVYFSIYCTIASMYNTLYNELTTFYFIHDYIFMWSVEFSSRSIKLEITIANSIIRNEWSLNLFLKKTNKSFIKFGSRKWNESWFASSQDYNQNYVVVVFGTVFLWCVFDISNTCRPIQFFILDRYNTCIHPMYVL